MHTLTRRFLVKRPPFWVVSAATTTNFDGDGERDGIEDALGTSAGGALDVLGDSTGTAAQPGGGAVLCRLGLPDPNFVRLVDST